MADQLPSNTPPLDEIDIGQVLHLIKRAFKMLGNFILRVFLYFKKNAIKLAGLVVLGVAVSFALKLLVPEKLKTDVIVRPNFESKNYLYQVVAEIEANIKSKDESFFENLDISIEDLKGFEIIIEKIEVEEEEKSEELIVEDMKYLEVLQNLKGDSFVNDILRSEISEKSIIDHNLTFLYKDPLTGPSIADKLINYINTNSYFEDLKKVFRENAEVRMNKNLGLINQIDELVVNYSKSLQAAAGKQTGGTVNIEAESSLNVPGLLNMKKSLLKEIEVKKLELAQQNEIISILNVGKTQKVRKPFFNQKVVLIPSLLVLAFFFISFLNYLNRKSRELQ